MIKRINTNILNSLAMFFILSNAALYLDPIPVLRWGFSILRFVAVVYAFAVAIPQLHFGKYTRPIIIFFLIAGVLTILHNGSLHAWLANAINTIGLTLLIYLSILQSRKKTIHTLVTIFDSYILINFICTLLYPDGIFDGSYLLGMNYNSIGPVLFCGLMIHYYAYSMQIRSRLSFYILSGISIATTIIVGSMTSTVGCIIITAFTFIPTYTLRQITLISFFFFYLVFQAFIVFYLGDISENEHAVFFIEEILQKDLDFTNRTFVWAESKKLIQKSPITGYGIQSSEWFSDIFWVKSSHNIIYQILIFGGYLLFSVFIYIIFKCVKQATQSRSYLSQYSLFVLCVFYFMMIMEAYNFVLIFLIQELVYYSNEFSNAIEDHEA